MCVVHVIVVVVVNLFVDVHVYNNVVFDIVVMAELVSNKISCYIFLFSVDE